jgi:hypothetical protein
MFYVSAFSTSCLVLSVMDGKFKQCVSIRFCVKLGKSTAQTPEMLHEALGEYSLSRTAVFDWHSRFKVGRVSVEDDGGSWQPGTSKTKQAICSQTPLGSVVEFARRC